MKKILNIAALGLLLGILFSCSGVKKVAEEKVDSKNKTARVEDKLSEEKQTQFEYLFVEALKQKMFGNTQKAIQLFSSCLEIDPNSSAAMYELANIYAANNDFTSSALLLEKAISINSHNKWYKLLLAKIYQQTKKFTEAVEIYNELLINEPENLEYLYMKAALLANAKKTDEAIEAYNAMEQKTGINEQISVAKQQLYVSEGKVAKAFKEIEKLINFNPKETKYYGLLADLYQSQGDSVNALKNYTKILEMDPGNGFVHFSLANYYLNKGNLVKSYEETKKGFSSDEVDVQTKMQMYMMLSSNSEKSKITDAQKEELIQILLKKHPGEFLVYTLYADYFLKKKMLKEARGQLLKALKIINSDYSIWERVLFIDNDLQDWNGLFDHTNSVLELFPNQPQAYFLHAIACVQLEKYDETITVADQGLEYVVDNPQLKGQFLMLKGEALYKQKKLDEAFKLFDKSVELDPDNYVALNNYAYYLSLSGTNLEKAERMSGKVIEHFPDNPTYLDTYAWVLFKRGEYKLAKFYMEKAIENGVDDNGTLFEHYGDILFKLNETDKALQYWKKAKNGGDDSVLLDRKIKEQKYIEK